ncbi:MAG: MCE family protein [Bacteriovoracaceae bacterium]|nr:MCE family protein [Bacteriovoracaceae bacterium]
MSELKVGLMALATLASVIFMSLKITSNQSGFGTYITYRTIIKNASGIFPKTPIKVAGIVAGRIKKIELQGNVALITFEVLQKVKVTKDSKLIIQTVGFLGDKYLEININENSNERIEELGLIESTSDSGIASLTKDAAKALKEMLYIIEQLKASIAPRDKDTRAPLVQMVDDMRDVMSTTSKLAHELDDFMNENEGTFEKMINNMHSFTSKLNTYLDDAHNDKELLVGDTGRILNNFDEMSGDLKTIIANIKNGRGTIGKILVEDEIADEVSETLSSVKEMVAKADAIRTEISVFSGGNTDFGSKTEVALIIRPSPERFYSLGVSTSKYGPSVTKELITNTDGVVTNEFTTETDQNTYLFDIQLGRKFHNWSFRGGLIQSTGGLGIDYTLSSLGINFGLEAFNYRKEDGINIRFSSELFLWNVVYSKLALEDLAMDSRSVTMSVGIRFLDEDLKSLIGFFF